MPFRRPRPTARLLLVALLMLTAIPIAVTATPPTPVAAQTETETGSLCTGDPNADVYGPCGSSLTEPRWSDLAGWDDTTYAYTISLVDMNGDGTDELLGLDPKQGVLVYQFSGEYGQWMIASDLKAGTQPFTNGGIVVGSLRFGELAEGVWGAIALPSNGQGLETWIWNPGDISVIGSGTWTSANQSRPFGNWISNPAYYSTIQFIEQPLGGSDNGYGFIGRGPEGVWYCSWDTGSDTWTCNLATSAFNDNLMTGSGGELESYYYDTVQLADLYSGSSGPELIGLENSSQSLVIYTWDSSSRTFTGLNPSGGAPFWSPQGQWLNPNYSSTIQPVQLKGGTDQPMQIIGRGKTGLEWHSLNDSGCGGHAPPCWKNETFGQRPLSDFNGYGQPQFGETLRFIDLDFDGIDEAVIRAPDGKLTTFGLHPNAGWHQLSAFGPQLSSGGPASPDPLWSDPAYYNTIRVGVITSDQRGALIARGKYGIRTFQFWSQSGWGTPYPPGFPAFSEGEQNAFVLASLYVGIDDVSSSNNIRSDYNSDPSTLNTWQGCLNNSLDAGKPIPPTHECKDTSPNSNDPPVLPPHAAVTAEQWTNMVGQLSGELAMAHRVSTYFNNVGNILDDVFFDQQDDLSNTVNQLFPAVHPPSHDNITALLFDLFFGFAEAAAILAGPEGVVIDAGLTILGAVVGGMESMQTPSNSANVWQGTVDSLWAGINTQHTEAKNSSGAMLEYVTSNRGLLFLYGEMLIGNLWNLTPDHMTAAESIGNHHSAVWIYQTMLPLIWQVWACHTNHIGEVDSGSCEIFDHITLGVNATELSNDDGHWIALIGHLQDRNAVEPSNTTFEMIFNPIPDNCTIGGTDPDNVWTYGCNVGVSYLDVLNFSSGWDQFRCTVNAHDSQNRPNYACGHGPPTNYGPPNS